MTLHGLNSIRNFVFPILMVASMAAARCHGQVLAHWGFDDSQELDRGYGRERRAAFTAEQNSGTPCRIVGLAEYVDGVHGTALRFDGFSSYVEGTRRTQLLGSADEAALANRRLVLDTRHIPFVVHLETQNFRPPNEKELIFRE